mgnify:CR=1 FL=1
MIKNKISKAFLIDGLILLDLLLMPQNADNI